MTDKYAVIGNPIAHSKSPQIHTAFAKQTGQNISYEAILASLDGFEAKVRELIKQGYKGANVTVPFKLEVLRINGIKPSFCAGDAGAANTLTFDEDGIYAENTDGVGLVRDIQQNLDTQISGKQILLIGAGGAAEGVLHPILEMNPSLLIITNRTLDKATAMVKKIELHAGHRLTRLKWQAFEDLASEKFDIVINATSTGLTDTALPITNSIFAKDCLAYEMMYGRETPFMLQARAAGAQVADGLGMLVEQAAEAFQLWRHVRPATVPVIEMLRKS